MHYTIMTTEDAHGHATVSLDKAGRDYIVGFYNANTEEYTHKSFRDMSEALSVYTKYVEAIATGCYSYEERKNWLK